MTNHLIENDAQWHALRARNIGGSEVAALFGLSPFITQYSLWHEKAALVPPVDVDNQKTNWGKLLEPLIAAELGKQLNWNIERSKHYYEHPVVVGAGCTLDFDVYDHEWGPGIVETKAVFDYADYKKDWSDDRAPPNYELQAQHQMAVTGRKWCAIQVWIAQTATMAPALIRRPNVDVIIDIERRIEAFWASIKAKQAPDPSGTEEELAIMRHLWPARAPKKVVEIADETLTNACTSLLWVADQIPGLEREKMACRAKLLNAAQDAELLIVPGFAVDIRQNKKGHVTLKVRQDVNNLERPAPPSTITAG